MRRLRRQRGATGRRRHAEGRKRRRRGARGPFVEKYVAGGALLGKGTNGKVLRAYEAQSPRPVRAMKFLDARFAQQEADLLRKVAHGNIIPLLDFFAPHGSRNLSVLVFPERDGDLGRFLNRRRADRDDGRGLCANAGPGQVPCYVPRWARQVASALAHMHSKSVLHRDLKPGNILLRWNQDAGSFDLELADLGSARALPTKNIKIVTKTTADASGRNVATHMELLTPHPTTEPYAAPEVWFGGFGRSSSVYGYSSDVWSYGAVLFEVITLKVFAPGPHDAARVAAVLRRLGPLPEGANLGPRQASCLQCADAVNATSIAALADLGPLDPGSAMGHVEQALRWLPRSRETAAELAKAVWADDARASSQGPGAQEARASSQGPGAQACCEDTPRATPGSRALSAEEVLAKLFPLTPEPERPRKRGRGEICQCAGHCNTPGHRWNNGCTTPVLQGQKYCDQCTCILASCDKPKHKTDFCHGHKRAFKKLPWSLKAARACREVLPMLVPCDLVVFLQEYPRFEGHLSACVLAAALKEPAAVRAFADAWVRQVDRGAPGLFRCMQDACRACDGAPHKSELQQLTRQGAGRWLGLVRLGRDLGLLGPVQDASASPRGEVLVLGLQQKSFCLEDTCPRKLAALVAECSLRQQQVHAMKPQDGVVAMAETLRHTLTLVAQKAAMPWQAYTVSHLVRKLLLAKIVHGAHGAQLPWDRLPVGRLPRTVLPDVKDIMVKAFPQNCSAADASQMVTGRPDQVLLLSMWACIFSEVEEKWPERLDEVLRFLSSADFQITVDSFKGANNDVAPVPATLISRQFKD